ncbi:MAG: hypothetical protein WC342_04225 [Methanoregula sp.]|jgi:hypothetical protein
MPRGRPKGSRNLSAYERGKVKRIHETLAQKGISAFDNLRDPQVLRNIYISPEGEVFINYDLIRNPIAETSEKKSHVSEKIIAKLEKNLAALREVI